MQKTDWELKDVLGLFDMNFMDLIYRAQTVKRKHFSSGDIQISSLLSIKTGGCLEDCAYCAQGKSNKSKISKDELLDIDSIVAAAKTALANGAGRFCMAAAGRTLGKKEFPQILKIIQAVKKIGIETCMSLGLLTKNQAQELKEAGLDYYNHNLDTSPEYYKKIISTRNYSDRLQTLKNLYQVGLKICCGGIIGMGESRKDRAAFLQQLANFPVHPHSVPINNFVPIKGTPLENVVPIDPFEFVRTIAVARILLPRSRIRLAAGRDKMSDELQALCFCAGANSIFAGEKLLTVKNRTFVSDSDLLSRLK